MKLVLVAALLLFVQACERLRGATDRLTPAVMAKARAAARKFQGKKYGLAFEISSAWMFRKL